MSDTIFAHNDPDNCHDKELTLHDCVADKITYKSGVLEFFFSDGFWIVPCHGENDLGKTVRTDASQVAFHIDNIEDVDIQVYTRNFFKKTKVEFWSANDLLDVVNSGKCTIEFIYQYRASFEQMWLCALNFKKKPYYKECYLHLPGATATYKWNNLLPNREW